jgi:hypothetical protein
LKNGTETRDVFSALFSFGLDEITRSNQLLTHQHLGRLR